jgi:hypothetical protein
MLIRQFLWFIKYRSSADGLSDSNLHTPNPEVQPDIAILGHVLSPIHPSPELPRMALDKVPRPELDEKLSVAPAAPRATGACTAGVAGTDTPWQRPGRAHLQMACCHLCVHCV